MKQSPILIVLLAVLLSVLASAGGGVGAQPSPNRVLFQGLPDLPAFDVRALGAVPDDGLDDTAPIQAAVDATSASPRRRGVAACCSRRELTTSPATRLRSVPRASSSRATGPAARSCGARPVERRT